MCTEGSNSYSTKSVTRKTGTEQENRNTCTEIQQYDGIIKIKEVQLQRLPDVKTCKFDRYEMWSNHGKLLWTIDSVIISCIRAIDHQTNNIVCQLNVEVNQWGGQCFPYGTDGNNFVIYSKTYDHGLLDTWDTGLLDTNPAHAHKTYTKQFNPDWFDLLGFSSFEVTPGKWRC